MPLPTDRADNDPGHTAAHNATNVAVNDLNARLWSARPTLARNVIPKPQATAQWQVETGNGSASGSVVSTGGPLDRAPSFYRLAFTASPTSGSAVIGQDGVPLTGGSRYTGSVWIRSSRATYASNLQPTMFCFDTNGAIVDVKSAPNVSAPANTWVELPFDWTVPGAAVRGFFQARGAASLLVNGDTFDAAAMIQRPGPQSGGYFDGDTPGCVWLGTPNISESVKVSLTAADYLKLWSL